VRGLAEQAESTESEWFKEPTDPLLSAREVSPRTNFPTRSHWSKGTGRSLRELRLFDIKVLYMILALRMEGISWDGF